MQRRLITHAILLIAALPICAADLHQVTPLRLINDELAKVTDLYEGLENEIGLAARLKKIEARKLNAINKSIIKSIEAERDELKKNERLQIQGVDVCDRSVANKIALGIGSAAINCLARKAFSHAYAPVATPPADSDAYFTLMHNESDRRADFAVNLVSETARTGLDIWLNPSSVSERIATLDNKIEVYKSALKNDPLLKTETEVLAQFNLIMPEPTRALLIRALLDLRKATGSMAHALHEQIQHCLNIPTTLKVLSRDQIPLAPAGSANIFADSSKLKHYSLATQKKLKEVMDKIVQNSQGRKNNSDDSKRLSKPIFFFYGEPATGKSFAANEIAEIFGLPKNALKSISGKEMSEDRMTGNREYLEPKLGDIFQTFFMPDKDGNSYLNPVLIIDEIDRALENDRELTNFLHIFFDSDRNTWPVEYFGKNAQFDIGDLIVIMTGNTDMGLAKALKSDRNFSNGKDKLKAIRDRAVFVDFDEFPLGEKQAMIEDYVTTHNLLGLSCADTSLGHPCFETQLLKAALSSISSLLLKAHKNESVRQLFRKAELLAAQPHETWKTLLNIDDFVELPYDDKQACAKKLLLDTKLFTSMCSKVSNVDVHAHEVSSFISKCFPTCTRDECRRFGFKLAGKSCDRFAELLHISPEDIKLREFREIPTEKKLAWLQSFFADAAFTNYFAEQFSMEGTDAADAIAATIIGLIAEDDIADLLRGAQINNKKAWPKPGKSEPERNAGHNKFLRALEII